MKKRVYVSLILTISISSLGWGVGHLNGIQQEIKATQELMETLENELENTKEAFNELDEENQNLKEKLDTEVQQKEEIEKEKEELQKEIDDMLKSVSLNTQNVSQPSGATLYHMKKALKGTTMDYLAEAFIDVERTYGINAFFMAGVVALESGWATSSRAYDGTNNLTGHAVYDDISVGTVFSSHYECVMITARDLKRDYLTPGGIWNNGSSIAGINVKYSASAEWKDKVAEIAFGLIYKANN